MLRLLEVIFRIGIASRDKNFPIRITLGFIVVGIYVFCKYVLGWN